MILSIFVKENNTFFQDINDDLNITNRQYESIYFHFNALSENIHIRLNTLFYLVVGENCPVIRLLKHNKNDLKIIFLKNNEVPCDFTFSKNSLYSERSGILNQILNLEKVKSSLKNNENKPYLQIINMFLSNPLNQYYKSDYKDDLMTYFLSLHETYEALKDINGKLVSNNGNFLDTIPAENFDSLNQNIVLQKYLEWKKTKTKKQILVICSGKDSEKYQLDFLQFEERIEEIIGENMENVDISFLPGSITIPISTPKKKYSQSDLEKYSENGFTILLDSTKRNLIVSQKFPDDLPMYESFFDLIFFAGCNSFKYLFRNDDYEKKRRRDIYNSTIPSKNSQNYYKSLLFLKTILKDDGKIIFQEDGKFVPIYEIQGLDETKLEIVLLFNEYFYFNQNEHPKNYYTKKLFLDINEDEEFLKFFHLLDDNQIKNNIHYIYTEDENSLDFKKQSKILKNKIEPPGFFEKIIREHWNLFPSVDERETFLLIPPGELRARDISDFVKKYKQYPTWKSICYKLFDKIRETLYILNNFYKKKYWVYTVKKGVPPYLHICFEPYTESSHSFH